ncbi:response regulator [Rhodobacteraceae bacterium D3-12]|nr:response regulator [Rhodobacteraceae bacterium D3-12]
MKILAVDDDPIILELLGQFVEAIGEHELTMATCGRDALEQLQDANSPDFDCFLIDIQMPEMDGVELTQRIRSMKRFVDTPILMLTAMSAKRYVDAAFAAGATDYVNKPFEVSELKARLSLVEGIVDARRVNTNKIFAAKAAVTGDSPVQQLELHEPISIYDVENVIDYTAMQNYVAQLSRTTMFGSATFAFTIRKIDEHHMAMSAFEYSSMISDVAEIISDTLAGRQFLMAYAGNGTFVCVTESGWRPDMEALMDEINLSLSQTELYNNAGELLYVRVSAGEPVRLIWQSEQTVMEALSKAHASAEAASAAYERAQDGFWLGERLA